MTPIDEIVRELRAHAQQCREFEQPVSADHLDRAAEALVVALARSRRIEEALRGRAIIRCERQTYGGGFEHVGWTCALCRADWDKDEKETHALDCLLSAALEDNPNA